MSGVIAWLVASGSLFSHTTYGSGIAGKVRMERTFAVVIGFEGLVSGRTRYSDVAI